MSTVTDWKVGDTTQVRGRQGVAEIMAIGKDQADVLLRSNGAVSMSTVPLDDLLGSDVELLLPAPVDNGRAEVHGPFEPDLTAFDESPKCFDLALAWLRAGVSVVPIPEGAVEPTIASWSDLRLTEADLTGHFVPGVRVGLLLGDPSGNLFEVQAFAPEAQAMLGELFPGGMRLSDGSMLVRCKGKGGAADWSAVDLVREAQLRRADPKKSPDLLSARVAALRFSGIVVVETMPVGDVTPQPTSHLGEAWGTTVAATILARHWPKDPAIRKEAAACIARAAVAWGCAPARTSTVLRLAMAAAQDAQPFDMPADVDLAAWKRVAEIFAASIQRAEAGKILVREVRRFLGVAEPMVPKLRQKNLRGWPDLPGKEPGGFVPYMPLSEALTTDFFTDAHFAAYSAPRVGRRLKLEALEQPPCLEELGGRVAMVVAIFDVDCATSHRALGGDGVTPAPDDWWKEQRPRIDALLAAHPNLFIYRTRGGYRVVGRLPQPVYLRTTADERIWARLYVSWCAYLLRGFEIVADTGCHEWVRLMRLPHATRDEGGKPEKLEAIGDHNAVGTWSCVPAEEDLAFAEDFVTAKPTPREAQHNDDGDDDTKGPRAGGIHSGATPGVLHHLFSSRGWLGAELGPGKWAARCPWEDGHSKGATFDSSTVLYAPDFGRTLGYLHCKHQSCVDAGFDARDVVGLFTREELATAKKAAEPPPPPDDFSPPAGKEPSPVPPTPDIAIHERKRRALAYHQKCREKNDHVGQVPDRKKRIMAIIDPVVRAFSLPDEQDSIPILKDWAEKSGITPENLVAAIALSRNYGSWEWGAKYVDELKRRKGPSAEEIAKRDETIAKYLEIIKTDPPRALEAEFVLATSSLGAEKLQRVLFAVKALGAGVLQPFKAAVRAEKNRSAHEQRNRSIDINELAKPEITCGFDEERVNDLCIGILASADRKNIFHRVGMLVRVLNSETRITGSLAPVFTPVCSELKASTLREILSSLIRFMQSGEEGCHQVPVPESTPKQIIEREVWPGIRSLDGGITSTPILRPDGTILQKPGYDADLQMLYLPSGDGFPPVPDEPTLDDARQAVADLLYVVKDFPFKEDCHRAAWLAMVLTPFARAAFTGPALVGIVDANVRGAGKTLLAKIAHLIFTGREMAVWPQAPDDTEEKKRLLAIGLSGVPFVCIDNLNRPFGGGALDAAMTTGSLSDRILGINKWITVLMTAVWWATGNNVVLAGDMSRRALHMLLDSPYENPELRDDMVEQNLEQYVRDNYRRLAVGCLTILRAYCVAGRPKVVKRLGTFEGWSDLPRSAVVWAGMVDPCASRVGLEASTDQGKMDLINLLTAWEAEFGETPTKIADAIDLVTADHDNHRRTGYPRQHASLHSALVALSEKLVNRQLARKLRDFKGRVVGGKCFLMKNDRTDTGQWWVGVPAPIVVPDAYVGGHEGD